MNPVSMKLELATCEPYFDYIHSGNISDGFMVIYSYSLDEFYENIWKEELQLYMKHLYSVIRHKKLKHSIIKNYNIIIRHFNRMQLVEIITDDTNREMCILHTYKINIFKKIWKKKFYNKIKTSLKYSNSIKLSKL
jgi:hypothetical protein